MLPSDPVWHYKIDFGGANDIMTSAAEAFELEDLAVGQHAEFETTLNGDDIDRFAALSGDSSPLHVDKLFARTRGYQDRVAHGAYLVIALLVAPRRHCICRGGTRCCFRCRCRSWRSALPGARVKVRGEIEQMSDSVRSIVLKLTVTGTADGVVLARGRLTVGFTAHG